MSKIKAGVYDLYTPASLVRALDYSGLLKPPGSSTLHGLRKDLGDWLQTNDDQIRLAAEAWVDERQFEEFLRENATIGKLAEGIPLYQGLLLNDFLLPDIQSYEDWIVVERQRYQRMMIRGMSVLSKHHEAQGDYARVLEYLEKSLSLEPLQEDIQREAMRLMYLAGNRPGAIRRYDELRRLLDQEMGVPPMLETRLMYDSILTDKPLTVSQTSPTKVQKSKIVPNATEINQDIDGFDHLPFVGRQQELQILRQNISPGRLILVEGEAGVGKSRLVEEFIHSSSSLALIGRAYELEQNIPLG